MRRRNVWIGVVLLGLVAGCGSSSHTYVARNDPRPTTEPIRKATTAPAPTTQRTLVVYDDFQNAQISEPLWLRDVGGGGTVSFEDGKATMDMSSPNMQKRARFMFPFTINLSAVGGRFRISWDQQIATDGPNGFGAGFGIVSHSTVLMSAGQLGQANGETSPAPYSFFVSKFNEAANSSMQGGTDRHHFELLVTPGESTLKLYRYHAEFNGDPEMYGKSGKLLETMTTPVGLGISIPPTVPLTLVFWNDCVTADDHFSISNDRGVISIEHVATDIPERARVAIPVEQGN